MTPAIDPTQAVGLGAAFCTTVAFLPQALKAWRSRSVGDLSLVTFAVFTFGVALWLTYGFLIWNLPIILANVVTLGLAGSILAMRLLFTGSAAKTEPPCSKDSPPS